MKDTVIVNFANSTGHYYKMQQRLCKSLQSVGYDGDIMFYNHEENIHHECPYHKSDDINMAAQGRVIPYAFKAYAIRNAIEAGYKNIIWADSAIYATKSITEFINHIEKNGYIFFDNIGYSVGDYTSDKCLERFCWSREKAFHKKMIMACLFGLNTENEEAMSFFRQYFECANDGISYPGSWNNNNGDVSSDMRVKGHRHDQSVASMIIADLNLTITNAQETFFAYSSHKGILKISDSICLWSEGI